jgi:DnaK suppressor protein
VGPQSTGHSSPGLTRPQLRLLQGKLLETRAVVLERLREEEQVARSADDSPEPMDAAELAREQGDGALFVERSRLLLREIEAALSRMASGTYGISERSGDPIGFDRLKAIPWARWAADEAVTEDED